MNRQSNHPKESKKDERDSQSNAALAVLAALLFFIILCLSLAAQIPRQSRHLHRDHLPAAIPGEKHKPMSVVPDLK